ncbi:UDP-N-acetyl-D-glucosamine dehydrogenase [Clostridium zeae]|uniref:UDP-N-acetyl-D-glucosamine dehydrogenase n=1 Tax=Clostridium zeae TaxID=2759022 RepID=A0ABQ1EFT7_9CLOT|nr:nucleotide sugar dehydrogenase [Clostridium zeae]GFZ33523.1 UDP-N-acetyl-D-glucosamine dehydrogenase [Clostridium zeae]
MTSESILAEKIGNKSAVVGIVGLGYVGLPLAVESAKSGFKVIGFDVQERKVRMINEAVNYIGDIVDTELKDLVSEGRLKAVVDFNFVSEVDIVLICVPTPLDKYQQPDISYVKKSTEAVADFLHKDMIVILESTTYPGTTEELIRPILEQRSGLTCEKDFYLAFSPERVDPGNEIYKTKNIPKVVGGMGTKSSVIAEKFYKSVLEGEVITVSSPRVAEMGKILENTYRNINIGLINEMAIICNKMNVDIWEVIEAAKSKPYGFQAFYPGPGLGGHCIPLDPYYLTWKAREYDYHTRLIETAGEINNYMPRYIVQRSCEILNRFNKPLNKSNILVLGIAYKSDIDDYRESPALKVIEIFQSQGAEVNFYDPYISAYEFKGKKYKGVELTEDILNKSDLVVITTDHKRYDYIFIQKNSKRIFDTRNAMKDLKDRQNIELL